MDLWKEWSSTSIRMVLDRVIYFKIYPQVELIGILLTPGID